MVFHKEPIITDRSQVIAVDAKRKRLRRKLALDTAIAQVRLHPKYRWRLWLNRNKAQARQVARQAKRVAKKSAPVIGLVGIGALLFAARGPISRWIKRLRN